MVNRMNRAQRSNMYNSMNTRGSSSYNGCVEERYSSPRSSCHDETTRQLMSKLQAVDFSLVDTVLYLDVYPHCSKAMARYKELLYEREKLIEKLSEAGVHINNMSVKSDSWSWIDSPWPWEYDANL